MKKHNILKYLRFAFYIVTIGIMWYIPAKKIIAIEAPATLPLTVDFKIQGYDPYDPGRGHFLALQVFPKYIDKAVAEKYNDKKTPYAVVGKDQNGIATVIDFVAAPGEAPCFKANETVVHEGKVESIYPFTRFYINEKLATDAERIFEEAVNANKLCVLRVKLYSDGASAVSALLIDGKDIRTLTREKQAEK